MHQNYRRLHNVRPSTQVSPTGEKKINDSKRPNFVKSIASSPYFPESTKSLYTPVTYPKPGSKSDRQGFLIDEVTAQAAHRNAPNGSSAKSRGRRMMDQSRIRGRRNYSHVSEKNLYQPHNIIGQTNTKTGYPTTYYHNSYTRGRVTTRHENPDNVGRESPRTDKNYYMLHRPHRKDASRPQMIETILDSDGVAEPIHHSRTGLVQAKSTKEQDLMHKTTEYYQYPKKNRGEE